MTTLVSLLFITMIPIDCKIFPYICLFVNFLVTIIILVSSHGSAASKEGMTANIIFMGAVKIAKNLYASKLCICLCSPHYTALQTEKSMKILKSTSCHYENMDNLLMIVCSPMIDESQ